MSVNRIPSLANQKGASVVEFVIAAPVLLLMGLGTLQAGLLYHSNTILNYATFEAARVGATKHAMPDPMKAELGIRLAPLYGGDGTMKKAAEAVARSSVEVESPVNLDGSVAPPTKIKILNPTLESFEQWGRPSLEYLERTAIPNSHLKHQNPDLGADTPAMSLADANLLKIQVTQGVELKIPFVNLVVLKALEQFEILSGPDPETLAFYQAGRIPLTSTATVRMQSEAWKESIDLANAPPPIVEEPDPVVATVPGGGGTELPFTPLPEPGPECNPNGLDNAMNNPQTSPMMCETDPVGGTDDGGSSPIC